MTTFPTSPRVRFAPSPTGYLHIGGVRTALFNWLFARRHGGTFILRVDDTDAQRNIAEALAPILDGFRWLGIDWDEGAAVGGPYEPYYQSQRLPIYQAAVSKLLASGHAYRDYARPEEIQAEKQAEWHQRLTAAQTEVTQLSETLNRLQTSLNDLSANLYSSSRTAVIQQFEATKAELAAAQQKVADLEEEGRRNRYR